MYTPAQKDIRRKGQAVPGRAAARRRGRRFRFRQRDLSIFDWANRWSAPPRSRVFDPIPLHGLETSCSKDHGRHRLPNVSRRYHVGMPLSQIIHVRRQAARGCRLSMIARTSNGVAPAERAILGDAGRHLRIPRQLQGDAHGPPERYSRPGRAARAAVQHIGLAANEVMN